MKTSELIKKEWTVGMRPRGMGHASYAILTIDYKLVIECPDEELAIKIMTAHNLRYSYILPEKTT